MNIWGFLVGLFIGIIPLLLILKSFRGKFLFISNSYIKGALFGFLLWAIINIFLYLEARYEIFGLLKGEEGLSSMVLITSSLRGFITAGLLAALISNKLWKDKAPKS
jgi:hypothetical protein